MAFLEFQGITKRYPGVAALAGISFGARAGSVHALMGENGAGKSTLLKILSGAENPTSGTVQIDGHPHVFTSTPEAIRAGVAVIYQELHLVPEMTVAENIYLGHLPARGGWISRAQLRAEAAAHLRRLGEDIDPDTKISQLAIAQRQMVEIAKALSRGARVIAFDEPTSSLSAREIDRLFAVIRDLRQEGCVVLYVTHRMEEVFQLCDACTVLRDGTRVVTHDSLTGLEPGALVRAMVGRDIADVFGYSKRPHGTTLLEVDSVTGPGLTTPVSLSVAAGEILGLFGLVGAGRTELLKILFGAVPRTAGNIRVNGVPLDAHSPREAIDAGLVYCTEDRKQEGIIPILSILENTNLTARPDHTRLGGFINEHWEYTNARHQIESLNVRTPGVQQLIKHLSGGNQQKVILGRFLSLPIQVLLLDEPTRGIDIGSKSEIYQIIFRLAREGTAIVIVSSDLPEVLGLADRVGVMRQGALAGIFPRAEATPELILARALPVEKLIYNP